MCFLLLIHLIFLSARLSLFEVLGGTLTDQVASADQIWVNRLLTGRTVFFFCFFSSHFLFLIIILILNILYFTNAKFIPFVSFFYFNNCNVCLRTFTCVRSRKMRVSLFLILFLSCVHSSRSFPSDFIWGSATASYQVSILSFISSLLHLSSLVLSDIITLSGGRCMEYLKRAEVSSILSVILMHLL